MSARSSSPILVTVLDTPAGPLSLLAHADTLVGAGFTGDPGSLHARLEPALRAAERTTARLVFRKQHLQTPHPVLPQLFQHLLTNFVVALQEHFTGGGIDHVMG